MVRSKESSPSTKRTLMVAGVTVGVIVIVLVSLNYAGVLSINPGNPPAASATDFTFVAYDYKTGELLEDARYNIYRRSILGLTEEQVLEGDEYSNYAFVESVATKYESPDTTENQYKVLCNLTGFDSVWIREPIKGLNTVYLLNQSDAFSASIYSKNLMETAFSNTVYEINASGVSTANTTTYTNERAWVFQLQSLNDDNETASVEGIRALYDFTTDETDYLILKIDTNATTADTRWISNVGTDSYAEISVSGDDIYIFYNIAVVGLSKMNVKFSTGLGSDFELESYSWGYGASASDFAALTMAA